MNEQLLAQMASLRAVAPYLNRASDDATAVIRQVETFLTELGIGVFGQSEPFEEFMLDPATEELDPFYYEAMADGTIYLWKYSLAYKRRSKGNFAIVICETIKPLKLGTSYVNPTSSDWNEVESKLTPWQNCSREVRLSAVVALPSLLANIEERAVHLAAKADEASGFAKRVMDELAAMPVDGQEEIAKLSRGVEDIAGRRSSPINRKSTKAASKSKS